MFDVAAYQQSYRDAHKVETQEYNRAYRRRPEHKERRRFEAADLKVRLQKTAWNKTDRGRETSRKYNVKRMESIQCRLALYLRTRLNKAVQRGTKVGSAVADLGCTIDQFKIYIESLFTPGMSWENRGAWHLDHKRPLASFDLTDRAQFLVAAHFTNYQPLWALDNLRKGGKNV